MHCYGTIGIESLDGDSFTDSDVAVALSRIGSLRAKVFINSPGGLTDVGFAIYNLLKRHPSGCDTFVDGIAASAASIVFLAGENRTMALNSRIMIHRAHTMVRGNQTELGRVAKTLDEYDRTMLDIYAEAMVATRQQIAKMLDDETWFDSEQALKIGLATQITQKASSRIPQLASWFKQPPRQILDSNKVSDWALESRLLRAKYKI